MMGQTLFAANLRRLDQETGSTLFELFFAAMIMAIISTVVLAAMVAVQRTEVREEDRSLNNDQARAAVQELDREVRSANVVYDPAGERDASGTPTPYFGLRVSTESNAPTRNANQALCEQWRVSGGQLLHRTWQSGSSTASPWAIAGNGIVNASTSPSTAVFKLDPSTPTGSRVVQVTLLVNARAGSAATMQQTIRIQTSLAMRNVSYAPQDPCTPVPAG